MLHQILRWHHLLSHRAGADTTANLVADGLFHAATWVAVVVGLFWLWQRLRAAPPGAISALIGALLAGWGLFNLVEGVLNHHLLQLHHVRSGPAQTAYDLGFLVLGALLVAAGTALYRAPFRGSVGRR